MQTVVHSCPRKFFILYGMLRFIWRFTRSPSWVQCTNLLLHFITILLTLYSSPHISPQNSSASFKDFGKNFVCISHLCHGCRTSHQFQLVFLAYRFWNLFIMRFPLSAYHFSSCMCVYLFSCVHSHWSTLWSTSVPPPMEMGDYPSCRVLM
jgi:hypothetical protein